MSISGETKSIYTVVMGESLGSLFHALWKEVAWLHREWHEYVALFGIAPSRIALLNNAAPAFFRQVQDSLWEGTLLHIARLTDHAQSRDGKPNLTIQALATLMHDREIRSETKRLVKKAMEACSFCRDWRNRRLAHLDRDIALSESVKQLEPASRAKVKVAIDRIADVLNAVTSHYMDAACQFPTSDPLGGAVHLLYVLDDGIKASAEREKRIQRGEIFEGDLSTSDI